MAYKGCAVVISHDQRFLDNISTHILDVDYETILLYTATTPSSRIEKAAERDRKEHEIEKREAEIAHKSLRRPLPLQGQQGARRRRAKPQA
jgi:ATPase subunit of ABC transporter with duplicated ATPase domains